MGFSLGQLVAVKNMGDDTFEITRIGNGSYDLRRVRDYAVARNVSEDVIYVPTTRQHELKTYLEYFEAIYSGTKTFELRFNDRGYKVGDRLWLREWEPRARDYTGRDCVKEVCYMLVGPFDGLEEGYVILGLENL